ncbi:MAG: relaxase/mobilization nuclease domain-containing protein, partial [Pseudomonadota bacterium]
MILEGNERGYGDDLAQHLQNVRQNDHVSIHAVDGFLAEDLHGAFAEAEAISGATQCSKYLFSLSVNPPIEATPTVADFEDAIGKAERRLGLTGQPRAIVFHEKNGRRHAHAVWSKIDAGTMRAINLSHYKRKLCDVSRELFLHHNWEMPAGLRDAAERDPNTFSRPEAQQAKRAERDPKALKAMFRRCWQMSDSRAAFAAALKEEGFLLARGDRRGFVAIDADGKVWSLSRWCGVKPKDLRARLGSEADLPSIEDVLAEGVVLPRTHKVRPDPVLEQRRANLVKHQREERATLLKAQEARRIEDLKARQRRTPKGLKAAFLHVTGRYQAVMREAEALAFAARNRDREEQQALIARHLVERRELSSDLAKAGLRASLHASTEEGSVQPLLSPPDDLALTKAELLRDPARILVHVSKTKARFTRADVLRELVKRIDDPLALRDAADRAMRSPELIRLSDGPDADYTTRDFRCHEERL